MHKNYYCEIMSPQSWSPGAGAPLAPWLIRHWCSNAFFICDNISYRQSASSCFVSLWYTACVQQDVNIMHLYRHKH